MNPYEITAYLDILTDNTLGNYRDIIASVVRAPAMARYLSHLRNDGNLATPNENFAREMLQLFSVGLVMLNADGTRQTGNPPTYTEEVVKGFAKSFTSLSYDDRPRTLRCAGDIEPTPQISFCRSSCRRLACSHGIFASAPCTAICFPHPSMSRGESSS